MNLFLILVIVVCLYSNVCVLTLTPNVTVDINGKGNYRQINQAIEAAPSNSLYRYIIYIKEGVYKEIVSVPTEKQNITIFGDGMERTVISNDRSNHSGYSIQDSGTLSIFGNGFVARQLTVENTAGPTNEQAVALRSDSRWSAFYQITIKGYQDSLYINNSPQFFGNCIIYGTVDFIFGDGPSIFQNCQILARQNLPSKSNTITANGCESTQLCGFSFHLCNIMGDKDLIGSNSPTLIYLGRPWKIDSTTVFMQSNIAGVINSKGWLSWNTTFETTLFYGEFKNSEAGAAVKDRIKWSGVHSILEENVAKKFTVTQFVGGENWLPNLGVPFTPGLV